MTREEAIESIKSIIDIYKILVEKQIDSDVPLDNEDIQALEMAISALSENKGEWKRISPAGIYECSCCGQNVMTSDIECYKFCHGCGARMKGGE